ncbi:VOC family protein [Streptomyces olivaceus]|uniref:VOC family protein n=1 Tax=Streptomyces olivaceus TaxID=47716 RepID=UPI00369761C7
MDIGLTAVVVDAGELEPESAFWHRLLGGQVTRTATHHFLRADGFPVLVIQRAAGHVRPRWPEDGTQQVHLDLTTDDLTAADDLALRAGAVRLRPAGAVEPGAEQGGRVYASPAGHPFCLRAG